MRKKMLFLQSEMESLVKAVWDLLNYSFPHSTEKEFLALRDYFKMMLKYSLFLRIMANSKFQLLIQKGLLTWESTMYSLGAIGNTNRFVM